MSLDQPYSWPKISKIAITNFHMPRSLAARKI